MDITPATADFTASQAYLGPAPAALTRYAWAMGGGKGEGVRVIDVEAGGISTTKICLPFAGRHSAFYHAITADQIEHGDRRARRTRRTGESLRHDRMCPHRIGSRR